METRQALDQELQAVTDATNEIDAIIRPPLEAAGRTVTLRRPLS